MDIIKIQAQQRETGRSAVRAIRRSGFVPCVIYGKHDDTIAFQMDGKALHKLVFTNELHRLEIDVEGKEYDCVLKDVDFHPISSQPIHADFQMLRKGEKIELPVPIRFVGKAQGQMEGGEFQALLYELTVSCLPIHIPDNLEIDITSLHLGDTLHVADLAFENLDIVTLAEQPVAAVVTPRILVEEVEEEEVEGEGEEETELTEESRDED